MLAPFAGWIADRFDKARSLAWCRALHIAALLLVAYPHPDVAVVVLGCVAAITSVLKYSCLPELVAESNLSKANGILVTARFIGIALGVALGGPLAELLKSRTNLVLVLASMGLLGWAATLAIPRLPAVNPLARLGLNPILSFARSCRAVRQKRSLLLSILGIAYFWLIVLLLRQTIPSLTALTVDHPDSELLLVAVAAGVALGGLLAAPLSAGNVELGLVPVGALGLTAFACWIFFASDMSFLYAGTVMGAMGVFAGLFHVPVLAMIQLRSPRESRGSIVAASNIAVYLAILASVWGYVALRGTMDPRQMFLAVAVCTVIATLIACALLPEFLFRFIFWCVTHTLYRVRVINRHHVPEEGTGTGYM